MVGISKEEASRLKAKMPELVKNLLVDEIFLTCFRRDNIFTENTQEEIEAERTTQGKASKAVREILGSSKSKAYARLIEALFETKQLHLAVSLDKAATEAYVIKRQQNSNPDEIDAEKRDINSVSLKEIEIIVDEVDSDNKKSKMNVALTNISEDERTEQKTQGGYPSCQIKENRRAIIINNRNFMAMKARDGTQFDELNIKELLNQLNFVVTARSDKRDDDYVVTTHNDKCDDEIVAIFEKLCDDPSLRTCEILMVFILSHGCRGAVYGSNDKLVYIQDILKLFTPERCPALADKPKLFFIQACQVEPKEGSAKPPEMEPPSDTLLAISTCQGYASWKYEKYGSWFMRTLVIALAKNAHNTEVRSILMMVCRIVLMISTTKKKQLTETRQGSTTKKIEQLTETEIEQLTETRQGRFKKCFLMT